MLSIIERNPTPEEYLLIRTAVGWGEMPLDVIAGSLEKSLYSVCIHDDLTDKILGLGRIVGDGGLCFYIQDIMIDPDYQKQGLGTKILESLMGYLQKNAPQNSFIGLMAAQGLEYFYMKFGFQVRPNEQMGPGMTLLWGNENT